MSSPVLRTVTARDGAVDFEKFRLRHFAERLVAIGEAEVHAKPIAMADLAAAIAATPKAIVFRDAGPEHFEIVAAAGGSRRRLAEAAVHLDLVPQPAQLAGQRRQHACRRALVVDQVVAQQDPHRCQGGRVGGGSAGSSPRSVGPGLAR